MSLFNMLYFFVAWLEEQTRLVFGGQEAQEGDSNDALDSLDDGGLYSLVICRWEGDPLIGLPEGVTLQEIMLFLDEAYAHNYIFGYDEKLRLKFVLMEYVEEIEIRQLPKKREKPEGPLPTIVQFPRKE